jgi:hypothetical protein
MWSGEKSDLLNINCWNANFYSRHLLTVIKITDKICDKLIHHLMCHIILCVTSSYVSHHLMCHIILCVTSSYVSHHLMCHEYFFKFISDLLTGQVRQSGMKAWEFDLAAKENAQLKEKLEKANQEIMALKNVKGKICSKVKERSKYLINKL